MWLMFLLASLLYLRYTSSYFMHYFTIDKSQLRASPLLNMVMLWTWSAYNSFSHACPDQQRSPCAFQFKVTLFCFLSLVTHPRPKIFPVNNVFQLLEHDVNKLYICHILGPCFTISSFAWSVGHQLGNVTHHFR